MNDDVVRLSVVGQIVRRRWRILVVAALIGALAGFAASLLFSPGYSSASRVLLQGQRDPDELQTETQIAVSSVVLEQVAAALRLTGPITDLQDAVTAEVVDGNVIEIQGSADDAEQARRLTDQVANEFVTYSSKLVSNAANAGAKLAQEQQRALQDHVADATKRIERMHRRASKSDLTVDTVQFRTELEALRESLNDAVTELDEAEAAATRATVVVIEPAELAAQPAAPTLWQLVAGGALLGFLLGIAGHLIAARSDRRLRGHQDIGQALGSPVLGSVSVPAGPAPVTGRWGRLARLLGAGEQWNLPASDPGSATANRYRRILGRMRGTQGVPLRLLVLVAEDDEAARTAALRLVEAAAADHLVSANGHSIANGSGAADASLQIAIYSPGRPEVPENPLLAGAVLVLSAGSRTAWELVAVTEACADAGHQVVGALVARPIRQGRADEAAEPQAAAAKDAAMAGGMS